MNLYREKVLQAGTIVAEEGVDLWMTIGRETVMNSDPVIPLICPVDFGGMTCIFVTKSGESIALASQLDNVGLEQIGAYDRVVSYGLDFESGFAELLSQLAPSVIALNYSRDVAADGLTHGLYLYLTELFERFGFQGKVVSSERIIRKLRGRKTAEEIRRITEATQLTEKILHEVTDFIKPGVSQKDIYNFCQGRIAFYGVGNAWDSAQNPGVFIGPNPVIGHAGPGDRIAQPGDLINLDFGVKVDDYCSDIQRTYYLVKDGETDVPDIYKQHLRNLHKAIDDGVALMKPGIEGYRPDRAARDGLIKQGYPEFKYSFGHQVGRAAHDGGVSMAKPRPGSSSLCMEPLEEGLVLTIDANLYLDRGRIGQEDVAYITKDGAKFISERQDTIWICGTKK
ncbi:MAG: M24 family metallopeptidase [Angelakisella sp.]